MYQVIKDFPLQFGKALKITAEVKLPKKQYSGVVIAGVGGSSLPAAIIDTYLNDEVTLPIYICQNYSLPPEADKKSLVFISSFSGNTEEVLSVYQECRKRKITMIGITTNGQLAQWCRRDNVSLIKLPEEGIQPRSGTGYNFTGIITAMTMVGVTPDKSAEIRATARALQKMRFPQAKKIARKLKNNIIIVYASEKFREIARIWKIKFNENAKVLAFHNYFPELNHNESTGFNNLRKEKIPVTVIILRNKTDHPRIQKRMDITKEIIEQKGGKVINIKMTPGNLLTQIWGTIYYGDFISYYLALEYNIDPSPVHVVEYLKKRLKK